MKIEYQSQIDDYLLNRMSDEERQEFERELNVNQEIHEQFSFTNDVKNVVKSRNDILAKIQEWDDDYKKEKKQNVSNRHRFKRIMYWSSGIAALFVAGFFIAQSVSYTGRHEEYKADSPKYGAIPIRGESYDYYEIEQMINQRKYDKAIDMINKEKMELKDDSLAIVQNEVVDQERKLYELDIIKYKQEKLRRMEIRVRIECDK